MQSNIVQYQILLQNYTACQKLLVDKYPYGMIYRCLPFCWGKLGYKRSILKISSLQGIPRKREDLLARIFCDYSFRKQPSLQLHLFLVRLEACGNRDHHHASLLDISASNHHPRLCILLDTKDNIEALTFQIHPGKYEQACKPHVHMHASNNYQCKLVQQDQELKYWQCLLAEEQKNCLVCLFRKQSRSLLLIEFKFKVVELL